jgi:hypothetical protein
VQLQNVLVPERFFVRIFAHVAQAGEIVQHLALRTLVGRRQFAAYFQDAHLFQCEWVALDGGGGMNVAGARIFLQGGNPRQPHGGRLNPFPQGRYRLDPRQQAMTDGELRLVAHGNESSMSQVISQAGCRQPELNLSERADYFDTMAGRVETGDTPKLAGEGLVQQRLFQRPQRGELPLVAVRKTLVLASFMATACSVQQALIAP